MKTLKITYVLPVYWPAIGGCELHTHELVKRLSERHNIKVLTLINSQEDKLKRSLWFACILQAKSRPETYSDNMATVVRLPLQAFQKYLAFPLARIQSPKVPSILREPAMRGLVSLYRRRLEGLLEGCDVVHCIHGGTSFLGLAACQVARKLGIPFVFTPVLHLSHPEWRLEMKECKRTGRPFIYSPQLHLTVRGWTDPYWHQLCFNADTLITMTEMEREFFIKKGIPEEKVIKTGVGPLISDNINTDVRHKYRLDQKKIVLFLGRNHESKGIEELLDAAELVWEKAPDTLFVFAGPLEGKSKEIFAGYNDPRVIITGEVSDEEKSALLQACDILCVPSLEESLGGVYLEAWHYGKPVIAADIPPLRDLTKNGQGGFLVRPEPADISEKLLCLLNDPKLRERMGSWGRQRVLTEFNWENIADKMEAVYLNLVQR